MSKQKGLKRIVVIILAFMLICAFTMVGCDGGYKEKGDFICKIIKGESGAKYAKLKGLSEAGKQKEILVIPEEIEGGKVTSLTYGYFHSPIIQSDVLKKVFVPKLPLDGVEFLDCKNLKKIVIYDSSVTYADVPEMGVYISSNNYSSENYYYYSESCYIYIANVSYMYNYDTTKNNGYYWIDDYDYGSKIEYIPKDPIRDGYTFGGWYKDSACNNKWDFETDTLPEEVIIDDIVQYQETRLYAKWETV